MEKRHGISFLKDSPIGNIYHIIYLYIAKTGGQKSYLPPFTGTFRNNHWYFLKHGHYFHIVGMVINPIIRVYLPGFLMKGGMTIPNTGTQIFWRKKHFLDLRRFQWIWRIFLELIVLPWSSQTPREPRTTGAESTSFPWDFFFLRSRDDLPITSPPKKSWKKNGWKEFPKGIGTVPKTTVQMLCVCVCFCVNCDFCYLT